MRGQEGDIVHVTQRTALQPGDRVPLSWEEFEALDSSVLGDMRAEYIDGQAIVMSLPIPIHGRIVRRLTRSLEDVLTDGFETYNSVGWRPTADLFGPDIAVFDRPMDIRTFFTATPYVAVEVLSTNRSHDTVLKLAKYAEAGLERYWIIDPDGPTITVFHLDGDAYTEVARHEPGTVAELDIGVGTVSLDPAELVG